MYSVDRRYVGAAARGYDEVLSTQDLTTDDDLLPRNKARFAKEDIDSNRLNLSAESCGAILALRDLIDSKTASNSNRGSCFSKPHLEACRMLLITRADAMSALLGTQP